MQILLSTSSRHRGEFDKVKDEMDIDSFTDAYIYGEEYPRKLEEYEEQPELGMMMGEM